VQAASSRHITAIFATIRFGECYCSVPKGIACFRKIMRIQPKFIPEERHDMGFLDEEGVIGSRDKI
jgi:hypothetical protein